MLDVVKYVAAVCAPTMALLARVIDAPDDRRDRARLMVGLQRRSTFEGPPG